MPEYRIESWWHVMRHATDTVTAPSPEAALSELKRRIAEEDFEECNDECCDSDGASSLAVWDAECENILAEELSDEERILRAAPRMLAALKEARRFATRYQNCGDNWAHQLGDQLDAVLAAAEAT